VRPKFPQQPLARSSPDLKNKYNDETLPNFIKRKHPRKGEKKKQGASTKVQASKQPKRPGPQGGNGTTKYPNLQ
jgi:hypothetical protein